MKRIWPVLLVLLLIGATACSTPAASEPESEPAATEEPTPEPTPTEEPSEEASEPLPSFEEGAGDLADLLPTEIAGLTIQYVHATGDQVVGSEDLPPEVQDFFDRTGATADDLSSAIGFAFDLESGIGFSILAFRVAGADEGELRTLFLDTFETEGSVIGEEESVGGKTVTPISDDGTVSGYVYVRDDVVFMVGGEPMTAVEEALEALP